MVTQDRAQSMYNATICHRSALPCFPYARRSGALAAVAGQTTTAAIKKDEAQERIEAPHSRAGRRLSRTGRVRHRGFHGAGERQRASLKLFCAAPFLVRLVYSKSVGGEGGRILVFFYRNIKTIIQNIETPKGQINWKVLYSSRDSFWIFIEDLAYYFTTRNS